MPVAGLLNYRDSPTNSSARYGRKPVFSNSFVSRNPGLARIRGYTI